MQVLLRNKRKKSPPCKNTGISHSSASIFQNPYGYLRTSEKGLCTGHQYILVFKDALTRYTELVALKTRTAEEVADAFIKHILCRHGCPEVLVSDNAAEFTSRVFKEVCRVFKIKTFNIACRHPASNGLCERQNIGISTYLKHYVNDSHTNWATYLSFCQAAINNTYHSGLKSTPHLVLKNYQYRYPWELQHYASPYMEEGQKVEMENLGEYTKNRYMNAVRIRDLAKIYLQEAKDSMLDRQHRNSTTRDINPGNTVYLKAVKPIHHSNKFIPRWSGPHVVQQRISQHRFLLKCRETGKLFTAHVDNFRITRPPFIVNNAENKEDIIRRPGNYAEIPGNSRNPGYNNDITYRPNPHRDQRNYERNKDVTYRPNPHGNSRYTGRDNRYERITRSKSNASTFRNNTRELAFHEIDEEDEEWLFRRRLKAQREGSSNNNNNTIIRDNAVNNEVSELNNNKSQ